MFTIIIVLFFKKKGGETTVGRDPRVRLDFIYIPKNAYEFETFFHVLKQFDSEKNIHPVAEKFYIKLGKEKQSLWERFGHSIGSAGSGAETMRDMLDFATYCGLMNKRFTNHHKTTYELNELGKDIVKSYLAKDKSVKNKIQRMLMNYKISNPYLDTINFFEFEQFDAHPYYLTLKILYAFEKRYGQQKLKIHQYDLCAIVTSMHKDSKEETNGAVVKLYDILNGTINLNDLLREKNYTYDEFVNRMNNVSTRLFKWLFMVNLINIDSERGNFFDGWEKDKSKKIQYIQGLTDEGRKFILNFDFQDLKIREREGEEDYILEGFAIDIDEPPKKAEYQIMRFIRDSVKTKRLKHLYDDVCQICEYEMFISKEKKYSEAHHIRPLGNKHNGLDSLKNMMVLCPNCHAEFDYGVIALNPSNPSIIIHPFDKDINETKLYIKKPHELLVENIKYHYQNIFLYQDAKA